MTSNLYLYSALTNDGNIRLLRLSPGTSTSDRIEGGLFEYTLSKSDKNAHLSEALSYAWGTPDNKHSIWIDGNELMITANCHAALKRLRDDFLVRIVWIDAICIDQTNKDERGRQVQLMAEIYCKASQVIVWLGEATPETDGALEIIRAAAERDERSLIPEYQPVIALLQRPWFRRIWVLQEVAAARHVVVACGEAQIDGYAFCLGLPPRVYEDSSSAAVRSIEFLVRRSIFRPKFTKDASGRVALGIRPLGELMDMYHSHEAIDPLDRVFALLGMSTDGLLAPELVPNYNTPWHILFGRLIIFVLGLKVSVTTFLDKQTAMICGKGTVIGRIVSVLSSTQNHDIRATIQYAKNFQTLGSTDIWTVHPAVDSIACGDVLCWLYGASKPMVIRPRKTHLSVIMVSVTPPQEILDLPPPSTLLNFVLVWSLEAHRINTQDPAFEGWLAEKVLSCAEPHPHRRVRESHLSRRVAQVLAAAGRHKDAAELFENVSEGYKILRGKDDLLLINCLGELATTRENLKQWAAAKVIWESIIRASYTISMKVPDIIAFSERLLVILRHGDYKSEESKWRAATRILQAKEYGMLLTVDKVFQITSSYDSEVVSILFDQWDDEVCVDERMLIAAAQNESHGVPVMELLLTRSSPEPEVTERILIAAAGNHLSGEKLIAMLLGRGGQEAKITQDVLDKAASNRRCNKALMQLLLAHQGIAVELDGFTKREWTELASFLTARHAYNNEATEFRRTMSLVESFWKLDDTTILRMVFSATHPAVLSRGSREILQFACDKGAFRHLRLFIHIGRPSMADIIHTLAYALLRRHQTIFSKLIEVVTCRYNEADDPRMLVAEEVVNGCSRIMETRTPAELSLFLDALNKLGIPFEAGDWFYTQSTMLPAVVSEDQSFLKILIERKLVHVRTIPFYLTQEQSNDHWFSPEPELVGEKAWRLPPAGMPDWPLFCAILFAYDLQIIRYLCRAGARLNCDSSDRVTDQQEPPIIVYLRRQSTLENARDKFANLMMGCIQAAKAASGDIGWSNLKLDWWWYECFHQPWTSMSNILQKKILIQPNFQLRDLPLPGSFIPQTWPEPLSNEESWKRWRDEAIAILSSESYSGAPS